jgi:hypothetical protein
VTALGATGHDLRNMIRRSPIVSFLLAIIACAQVMVFPSPPPGQARFGDPGTILAASDSAFSSPLLQAFPKYPSALESAQISGALVDAFVIDTTGRVDLATTSFIQTARPEFALAVCEMLSRMRYAPLVIGGAKRRALITQTHVFVGKGGSDEAGEPAASALRFRSQEEFASAPIVVTIRKLEPLPHCDTIKP